MLYAHGVWATTPTTMTRSALIVLLAVVGAAIAAPANKPKQPKKPADITADVAALAGPDIERAAHAATTLGTYELSEAHAALLDALAIGLAPPVALPALAAVAQHPVAADVAALKRYAGHHTPSVRSAALGALAGYSDPAARAAIVAGLHDNAGAVRAAAATAAANGRIREAADTLLLLLGKREDSAIRAVAQLADPDLARTIADRFGRLPDASLALCLGLILRRGDFGPDPARVEIVRALATIQDPVAIAQLSQYVDETPNNPRRPSRIEAEMVVGARRGQR